MTSVEIEQHRAKLQTMSTRQATLLRVERQTESMLATLGGMGERGLCDDLSEFRERLFEALAAESEEVA